MRTKDSIIGKEERDGIEERVTGLLTLIGEDPNRKGLIDTPKRVAGLYSEIFQGYNIKEPKDLFKDKIFDAESEGIVVKKDISFFSMCEHHMVPFSGKVHIGYIPQKGKVVGISKLVRVVYAYALRLQIQEKLTAQIVECIMKSVLNPEGVVVVIEAQHLCEVMRGVKNSTTVTITSEVRGIFRTDKEMEQKFFQLIGVSR